MNITLIVVLLIILLMAVRGYKKGMTKEIIGMISLAVTLFVISLIIVLYVSFRAEETKNIVFTIIILLLVAIVYSVVKIFLKSAKLLSKLPVIKIIDRFLGIFIGAAEGLLLVWLLYILNSASIFGSLTEVIARDTVSSQILSKLCEYNYLLRMIDAF
ncbi:MAG: CvpA family protein [Lachnospiraceae bacterium]|nr:CvpA family protein [Lachnospiraceae bacterium]